METFLFFIIIILFIIYLLPVSPKKDTAFKKIHIDPIPPQYNPNALCMLDYEYRKPIFEDESWLAIVDNSSYKKININAYTIDFVVFDFETANRDKTSACAIGLAFVKNLEVVESKFYYISPQHDVFFLQQFIDLHHITWDDVYKEPFFNELWPELSAIFETNLMLAYNLVFDIDVLTQTLNYYGIPLPPIECNCILEHSRKYIKGLKSYKLSNVCENLNIQLNHHQAESDAVAAAQIMIRIIKEMQESIKEKEAKSKVATTILKADNEVYNKLLATFSDYPLPSDANYEKFVDSLKRAVRRCKKAATENPDSEAHKNKYEEALAKYKIVTGKDYVSITKF